ncbi:MAG: hypothetical protein AAFQ53_07640, partial [Bacteroidota bacterium]
RADFRGEAVPAGIHFVGALFQCAGAAALFADATWIAGGWGAAAVSCVVLLALLQSLVEARTFKRAPRSCSAER